MREHVGVIGAGTFGSALAHLLSRNCDVTIFARNEEVVNQINSNQLLGTHQFNSRVKATISQKELCEQCNLIFPAVPSLNFREMIKGFTTFLKPHHMLIHATKGFDNEEQNSNGHSALQVKTMSKVIYEESVVRRVGCLAGPNLAREILDNLPAAAVIASPFNEVVTAGKKAIGSNYFHVFGSNDMLGAEIAGALKNVIAIGSGILGGKKLGKNLQAILIQRGLYEMLWIGKKMGSGTDAYFGAAGIGDLLATATSEKSRNYQAGLALAAGANLSSLVTQGNELAEGIRTLKIAYNLAIQYKIQVPIFHYLYKVVYQGFDIEKAIEYLIKFPYDIDVDFR